MSQQAGLVKRPETTESGEQPVRPKVMRRPTHFSSKDVATPQRAALTLSVPRDDTPDLAALPLPAVQTIAPRIAWQDDVRFGAVMLAVVVITNLALMLWLPHMHRTAQIPAALIASDAGDAASLSDHANNPVTLYSSQEPTAEDAPDTATSDETPAPVVHVLGDAH